MLTLEEAQDQGVEGDDFGGDADDCEDESRAGANSKSSTAKTKTKTATPQVVSVTHTRVVSSGEMILVEVEAEIVEGGQGHAV